MGIAKYTILYGAMITYITNTNQDGKSKEVEFFNNDINIIRTHHD